MAIYAALGLIAYWPAWPGDPARVVGCPCGDASESAWFLAWTPHAVVHGFNPFFTTAINHPVGINLAANATMPLLGLLALPVTLTAGPVASLNLLLWAAFPLSAGAMYFVLRRWTEWAPAAFVGGLLYGFSPYMVGQGRLHLNLVFVPLPPLIFLAVYELFVRREASPLRWGAALGGLVIAQYFISTEVLATTVVVGVVGLALLAVTHPRSVAEAVRHAAAGGAVAGGLAAVVVAYPTWMVVAGPERYRIPVAFVDQVSLRAGLGGAVAPTTSLWFAPHWLTHLGGSAAGATDIVENGSYLGLPLLLLVGYFVIRFRGERWLSYLAVMAASCYLLSLGPHLTVGSDRTGIPLPFAVVERVPLLELVTPVRLSLYVALFLAVLVGLGFDDLHRARLQVSKPTTPGGTSVGRVAAEVRPGRAEMVLVGLLTLVVALTLVPRWPVATSPIGVPRYFTTAGVQRIPVGSTVLVYPYPVPGRSQAMLWQATADFSFDLLGSYSLHPVAGGLASQYPTQLRPVAFQQWLYPLEGAAPAASPAVGRAALGVDVRRFLRANGVAAVLVDRHARGAGAVARELTSALGRRPVHEGGIDAWYGVRAGLARRAGAGQRTS
ncbi:MAG TPA: hypothetical protein VMB82_07815 [Acidimicrobiales bacterium]|nr:hypothetical protein [Acidimicrobiales bacterium]